MPNETEFRTPGQLIEHLLNERNWTQEFLAFLLNVNKTTVSKMVSGTRSIDAATALELEEVFGTDAKRFLELQQAYDLRKAEIVTVPNPERATRAKVFGRIPVTEMVKRGWLRVDNPKDVAAVEKELLRFFRVGDLNEIEVPMHAAKKTNALEDVTGAQLVWLYRVRQMAEDQMVASYSELAFRRAIKELEPLMISPEGVRQVPRILERAGVRFVICESTSTSKIDGVSCWLDEQSPVIGMSLRYDRIDNFWFVLRHECEHILKRHGQESQSFVLDVDLEHDHGSITHDEEVANDAAADFGVSRASIQNFINRKAPFFREMDVLGFARTENVHPGIVVGRLQRATGRYDLLRKHLVKIRSRLVQDVIVDGWGDVAPVDY